MLRTFQHPPGSGRLRSFIHQGHRDRDQQAPVGRRLRHGGKAKAARDEGRVKAHPGRVHRPAPPAARPAPHSRHDPGEPVHVVAARLGHADPAITLRVYAHVIRTAEATAADIFTQAVKAA